MATVTLNFKPPKFRGRSNEDIDGFLAKLTAYFGKQTTPFSNTEMSRHYTFLFFLQWPFFIFRRAYFTFLYLTYSIPLRMVFSNTGLANII